MEDADLTTLGGTVLHFKDINCLRRQDWTGQGKQQPYHFESASLNPSRSCACGAARPNQYAV